MCTWDAKDDATGDIDSMILYWLAMEIRSVENFDLAPNLSYKGKGDGVDSRGGRSW